MELFTSSNFKHTLLKTHCISLSLATMRPDSLLRLWRYINPLFTYLLTNLNDAYVSSYDPREDSNPHLVRVWPKNVADQALLGHLRRPRYWPYLQISDDTQQNTLLSSIIDTHHTVILHLHAAFVITRLNRCGQRPRLFGPLTRK